MMRRRKRGWIGIDLGTRAVKIAQVERSAAGVRIAASVLMQRSRASNAEPESPGEDSERPGHDVLAALSRRPGFHGRKVACVLPMRLTDLQVLAIPPGETDEQRAMVAHQLGSMFAGEEQPREFDFWETGPPAKANPSAAQDVNVLSVPRTMVSRVLSDLSRARLSCQVMDGLPFALARAVKLAYHPDLRGVNRERNGPRHLEGAPIAAIDWGFSSATFCVVSEGRPLFTRHLRNCGLTRLVGAVSRAMGLSEDDALQLLLTYGMLGPRGQDSKPFQASIGDMPTTNLSDPGPAPGRENGKEVSEILVEVTSHCLGEMAAEIEKTISYLRMQYPGILPERLCLFGSGATVKNVPELLSERVRLPIEVWRLPHLEDQRSQDHNNPPPLFGTAVALSALAWSS